jgi:hypothetical protein
LIFESLSSPAQAVSVKKIILTWDFFVNDKPPDAKFDALTFIYLTNRFQGVGTSGAKLKFTFDVSVTLDTAKSYFGYEGKYRQFQTLKHEQGHVDLAVLYARKLLDALLKNVYTKTDYQSKIHTIYENYRELLELEQVKYDAETEHGTNSLKQNEWNLYFKAIPE